MGHPEMGTWTIRRAEHGDAAALASCMVTAYARFAARISDLPPVSIDCAEEIARFQVWVAEARDTIIGGLVLVPEEGFLRLANVAVHPVHRGEGLGRTLMELAEREALAQGYRELRLNTHAQMPENLQLYAHLGWKRTSQDGNKVSMTKRL